MSDITMDEISVVVSGSSDKASESLERLITALDKLEGSVSSAINGLKDANNKINNTTKGISKVKDTFKNVTLGITKFGASLGIASFSASKALNSTVEYIQAYAGFNKVLGTSQENLEKAKDFVEDLTEAWYLDDKQVMQATSRYYNMMSTMGMTEDAAFRMSKNLTMLSYDLQLLGTTGATVTEVQNQIGSALRGEAEGLAKFGISLNQATLQTVLYEKGINRTVSSLTAAQKAELIYYQIMRQTYNKHGYYAQQLEKDVLNPAIAVQALKNQFINLSRAIGSIFIPILSALTPYIIAITQLLTQLAKTIANFLGFELGDWGADFSDITDGFGGIADSASKAGKEVKGVLRDFDELHVVKFPKASGTGIGAGGSLGLDPSEFEYGAEWLEVTNEKLEKAKRIINDIKDYLIAIGIVIAGYKISKGVLDFFGNFLGVSSEIKNSFFGIALGIGMVLGGSYLIGKAFNDISENGLNLNNGLKLVIGYLIDFIGIYGALKALKAIGLYEKIFGTLSIFKAAGGLSLVILGLIVFIKSFTEVVDKGSEATDSLAWAMGALGTASIGLAIIGAPLLAIVGLIAGGIYMLAGYCVELKSRIENLFDPTVEIIDAWDWMADGIKNVGDVIKGVSGATIGDFDYFSDNAVRSLREVANEASQTSENIDGYLNTDLSNSLLMSQNDIGNYGILVNDIFKTTNADVSSKIQEMQKTVSDETKTLKENAESNFTKFQSTVDDKMKKVEGSLDNVSDSISSTTTNIDVNTSRWKGMLERGNQAQIKTPTFSWKETINNALSMTLKTALGALGLPIALPSMSISWFAEGGFPTRGDLFVANEAGAEWVGSMNGRTAVANNDQISKGVEQAAYQGMARALQEYGYAGVTVKNYMDGKEIASKTTKIIKSNANMYG